MRYSEMSDAQREKWNTEKWGIGCGSLVWLVIGLV